MAIISVESIVFDVADMNSDAPDDSQVFSDRMRKDQFRNIQNN